MRKSHVGLLLLLLLAYGCEANQANARKVRFTTIHPVLNTWVVEVPSIGRIISVSGQSWKLDKTKKNYVELHEGSSIEYGDLLQLRNSSLVTVQFDDHSTLKFDPRDYPSEGPGEDVYFTIEKKEQQSSNQAL